MAATDNPLTATGLLTIIFTEAIAMIVFHGTPVGEMMMEALGLEHGGHMH